MPDRCVALRGLPTRATVSPRQRGFSLLELLVALVVVVLVTTLVNLSVNSGGQDIRLEAMAHELEETGSYALDEAQTTGVDYGLLLDQEQQDGETVYSINWLEHRVDGWADPQSGKEVFAKQNLPPGIALELELEDSPLTKSSADDDAKHSTFKHSKSKHNKAALAADDPGEEDTIHPQVVFYSSGETTVGAINVRQVKGGELLWRIEWDLLGRFKVLRHGKEEESEKQQQSDKQQLSDKREKHR